MKKNTQIGVAVLIIALIGTGIGLGAYFIFNQPPPTQEEVAFTIFGDATTGNLTLTMSDLKSDKYVQVTNLQYNRSSDSAYNLTGVSIRSILEEESLLTDEALFYTVIASDGYNAQEAAEYYLNITKIMEADYDEAILAYGGEDFDVEGDGPIRSVLNITLDEYGDYFGKYWMKQCNKMEIIKPHMTLSGDGLIRDLKLNIWQLIKDYTTFTNLQYNRSSDSAYNLTGVSIRSILEDESLLSDRATFYSFIASDGYDAQDAAEYYLNITKIMEADYDEAIFAYGGEDFDVEGDGPIRAVLNITLDEYGFGFGKYWMKDCVQMQIIKPHMTIFGDGLTRNLSLNIWQLKNDYTSFTNLLYNRSSDSAYNLTGVSIRSILEDESLLAGGINYTFIASDDYNAYVETGYYLNITKLMEADYDEAIFAYGGEDFDIEGDGPIRAVLNITLDEYGFGFGKYWMKHCDRMQIIA